jgi:ACS family glucarate transporter-like MFS transporter
MLPGKLALQPRYVSLVLLMIALSAVSYFDRVIMSIAAPRILNEFALSETQMGWIYSAFILTYAVFMAPGGALADRFGADRVLLLVGFGSALFTAITACAGMPGISAWVGIFPSFLIVRLALGACTAPLYPSCARINATVMPAKWRARVWGGVAAGCGIGGACAPPLFTLMQTRWGWRRGFCLSAAGTAVLALAWWCVRADAFRTTDIAQPGEPDSSKRDRRQLLLNPNLLLLTLAYAATNYFEYIFFYWLFYYFGQIRHIAAQQSAMYTTFIWLSWAAMTPIGGWVSDRAVASYGRRQGRRLVPIFALTFSAILLYLATSTQSSVAMVSLLCVALGCAATTEGPFWVAASEIGSARPAAAAGVMNTGGSVGGFLAPVITPFVAARGGWPAALYTGSAVVLGAVVLWFFVDAGQPDVHREYAA